MGFRDMVGAAWDNIGTRKSPALVALGFFEIWLGYKIALTASSALTGFAAVVLAVNGAAFLGGAWKNHSDKKYGNGSPQSGRSSPS